MLILSSYCLHNFDKLMSYNCPTYCLLFVCFIIMKSAQIHTCTCTYPVADTIQLSSKLQLLILNEQLMLKWMYSVLINEYLLDTMPIVYLYMCTLYMYIATCNLSLTRFVLLVVIALINIFIGCCLHTLNPSYQTALFDSTYSPSPKFYLLCVLCLLLCLCQMKNWLGHSHVHIVFLAMATNLQR